MITRLSASIIGLLAFAGCILMGLVVGNPFETIILRALGGLAGGMVIGWFAGYVGQLIVQENFRLLVEKDIAAEAAAAEAAEAVDVGDEGDVYAAEAQGAADGRTEVTEDGGSDDRMKEDGRSEEQSLSARAARELITNAQ